MKGLKKMSFVLIILLTLAGITACDSSSSGGGSDNTPPSVVSVTGVELDMSSMLLTIAAGGNLTATVYPSDATNKNVTWSIDDEDVATVESGYVHANHYTSGTAEITVSTEDGNFQDTCTLTVAAYIITVNNRTEGILSNVSIDSHTCGRLDLDESCSNYYMTKPATVTISKQSDTDIGNPFDDDIIHDTSSIFRNETLNLSTFDFSIGDYSLYTLWVRNSTGDEIDFIGFNWDGSAYLDGYNLDFPITNNGLYRFIGFIDVQLSDVDLWADNNNDDILSTGDDSYWTYSFFNDWEMNEVNAHYKYLDANE